VKINRATIANFMRLLELPQAVQGALTDGKISAGHARTLLPLGDEAAQLEFCKAIERDGLSVRDVERMVKERIEREDGDAPPPGAAAKPARTRSDHVSSLEQEMRMALGAKVEVRQTAKGRGRIVIHFKNHDEFERVFDFLTNTAYEPQSQKAS
jgi:ParB family chromosome partitioning protein